MNTKDLERAQAALRVLEALGLPGTKEQWRELSEREAAQERGQPSEFDLMYTVPAGVPAIAQHFEGKVPEVLTPEKMWQGYHYSLSKGQRQWLRENTALTPSATVTIAWVEVWPGTQHPRSFKMVSDTHIDPRVRRHVLSEIVLRDAGRFFHEAQAIDNEERSPDEFELTDANVVLGGYYNLASEQKWAVQDLTDAKVKVQSKVQITYLSETQIRFEFKVDKQLASVVVGRKEFFDTTREYVKAYGGKGRGGYSGPRRRKVNDPVVDVDALMKELGATL